MIAGVNMRRRNGIGASALGLHPDPRAAPRSVRSPSSRQSAGAKQPRPSTSRSASRTSPRATSTTSPRRISRRASAIVGTSPRSSSHNPREWRKGPYEAGSGRRPRLRPQPGPRWPSLTTSVVPTPSTSPRDCDAGDRVFASPSASGAWSTRPTAGRTSSTSSTSWSRSRSTTLRGTSIAVWKLSNTRRQLLLLSNEPSGDPPNVSFEREFGKLIVLQDVLARILAQHENRTLRRIVQQLPTAVFLPVK